MDTIEQTNKIVDFLRRTHPALNEKSKCVEIRPILRDGYDYKLNKSLCLWDLSAKSIDRLNKFLTLHNEKPCCLYYSVFTFDYDKKTKTKSGKDAEKGRITSEAAVYTEEIVLDFDGVTKEDFFFLITDMFKTNLDVLWVATGHGYHCHILLNEKVYDKNILKKMVYLFRSKGFKCDTACIDIARVMRLPATYNYKKFKSGEEPIPVEVETDTETRYAIVDIIEFLKKLPTVSAADEKIYLSIKKESVVQHISRPMEKNQDTEIKQLIYPYISEYNIPTPIKHMLLYCPEGYRNKTLGFLIKFFKQILCLPKTQIKEILTIWSMNACVPAYNYLEDFERLYSAGGLNYSTELSAKFGYIDFENEVQIERNRFILIPNSVLSKLDMIDSKTLKVYFAIKALEYINKETTLLNIANFMRLSECSIQRFFHNSAITNDLFYREINNKKEGKKYVYHTTKIISIAEGYSKYSFNDIKAFLDELTDSELKLYIFMNYKCFATKKCFMSQSLLGKEIGLKRTTVNELLKALNIKYFINVAKTPVTNNVFYCTYTLLR